MNENPVVTLLRNPETIRTRAQAILHLAHKNQLHHFTLNKERMTDTASFVTEVILEQYPDLDIPYHSRWRHFEAGGIDRVTQVHELSSALSAEEQGKILYELVIISVLLDAGAGASWHYHEAQTNLDFARSEGLALASFHLYLNGAFSAHPRDQLRVDARRLQEFSTEELQTGFQVHTGNPLEGISGRVALLNRLGQAVATNTLYFGDEGRLGDFFTYICSLEHNNCIDVTLIFKAVLNAFSSIWPARLSIAGIALGDVWHYPKLKTAALDSDFVPFHKLSQWLTYSLIEPLEHTGIKVTNLEALTGLPEYRNGGLLIDSGLLGLKNPDELLKAHDPGSELIVEWRALTVALLDELATLIRKNLNKNAQELPLAKILQGGTWEAGRRIARQKRPQGTPPIQIISDGTVF